MSGTRENNIETSAYLATIIVGTLTWIHVFGPSEHVFLGLLISIVAGLVVVRGVRKHLKKKETK